MTTLGVDDIAAICHEANRALCAAAGDHSQVAWGDAPQWQRDAAVEGVRGHLIHARTPEGSHELWCDQKRREGWTYGPRKDSVARTHPCLVPYDQLPPEQRAKDHLFAGIVAALKPFCGASS